MGATIRIRIELSVCGVPAQKFSYEEEKQNRSIGGEIYGDSFFLGGGVPGGVIHVHFLEPGTTIVSDQYIATLINLKQRLTRIGRKYEKILLQYDNARPHASSATMEGTARSSRHPTTSCMRSRLGAMRLSSLSKIERLPS